MGELDSLIHFWKDFLFHDQAFLEPSMIWQIEQTIKHLQNLQRLLTEVKL